MKLALILGNCEYDDTKLSRLKAPAEDVHQLAKVLRDPAIGNFDKVEVLENRPYAEVHVAIGRFFLRRKPDDMVLLYFSGHGIRDENGNLFLAVKDTDQEILRQTSISAASIRTEMDQCGSRTQILMLDCCHSGAFGEGGKGALNESVGTQSAFEGSGYGRVVLTATDALQFAWEGDRIIGETRESLFTHFLIKGMESGAADLDNDGLITLDDLYEYTFDQIRRVTSRQTPQKWNFKQQGRIHFAGNPNPIIKPQPLPADILEPLHSSSRLIREAAFTTLENLAAGTEGKGLALSAMAKLKELAEDDSRKVAELAQASLNRLRALTAAIASPAPESPAAALTAPAAIAEKPAPDPAPDPVPRQTLRKPRKMVVSREPAKTGPEPERKKPFLERLGLGSLAPVGLVLVWLSVKFLIPLIVRPPAPVLRKPAAVIPQESPPTREIPIDTGLPAVKRSGETIHFPPNRVIPASAYTGIRNADPAGPAPVEKTPSHRRMALLETPTPTRWALEKYSVAAAHPVYVISEPADAEVTMNGIGKGKTPLKTFLTKKADNRIIISHEGYKVYSGSFSWATAADTLRVTLEKTELEKLKLNY